MQRAKIKRQKENLPDEGQQRKIMVASHMLFRHAVRGYGGSAGILRLSRRMV